MARLFYDDDAAGIRPDLVKRCRVRFALLDAARSLDALKVPSWRLHELHVEKSERPRYAIAVSGPWQITFRWTEGGPDRVELEQYH